MTYKYFIHSKPKNGASCIDVTTHRMQTSYWNRNWWIMKSMQCNGTSRQLLHHRKVFPTSRQTVLTVNELCDDKFDHGCFILYKAHFVSNCIPTAGPSALCYFDHKEKTNKQCLFARIVLQGSNVDSLSDCTFGFRIAFAVRCD